MINSVEVKSKSDRSSDSTQSLLDNSCNTSLNNSLLNQQCGTIAESTHIKQILDDLPELDTVFTIHKKIGEGTFSSVFLATLKSQKSKPDKKQFAIKHLIPTSHPKRIEKELKCLQTIGGVDNVVGVDLCIRKNDAVAFVMPFISHLKFSQYAFYMDPQETQLYIKNLLIALQRVHSFSVIHRDIKPSNFLYDRENRKFLLVDFGLAQYIEDQQIRMPRLQPVSEIIDGKRKRSISEENNIDMKRLKTNEPLKIIKYDASDEGGSPVTTCSQNTKSPLRQLNMNNKSTVNKKLETFNCNILKSKSPVYNTLTRSRNITRNSMFEFKTKRENEDLVKVTFQSLPVLQINTRPTNNKQVKPHKLFNVNQENENIQKSVEIVPKKNNKSPKVKSKVTNRSMNLLNMLNEKKPDHKVREQCDTNETSSKKTMLDLNKSSTNTPTSRKQSPANNSTIFISNNPPTLTPRCDAKKESPLCVKVPLLKDSRNCSQNRASCVCYGKPLVCNICLARKQQVAPRAGTPGFRPPEVLLKYPHQTTAVDIWACGVILICILSSSYPFFNSPDDMTALAEIISLFGGERVKRTARSLGCQLIHSCSSSKPKYDLPELCKLLRSRKHPQKSEDKRKKPELVNDFPCSIYDLLSRLLELNPHSRITAAQALGHPFFQEKL